MKKLVSILLAALMLVASMCAVSAEEVTLQGENISKGKTVTASASHDWYPAYAMVDGHFSDSGIDGAKWRTPNGTIANGSDVYAVIDLGKPYNIYGFKGEIWYDAYSTKADAKIYGSVDGVEFTDLLATISGEGVKSVAVTAEKKYQYIKVQGRDWPGLGWGVWELEVYGEDKVELKGENVALKKTVTANTSHDWYPAHAMVDGYFSDSGIDGAKWRSPNGTVSGGAEVYAIVDLGKPYSINAVRGEIWWDTYCTKNSGTVSASVDGVEYETIGKLSGEGVQAFEVYSDKKYRYVKVQSKDWPGLGWGLWELEVYSEDKFEPKGRNVAKGKIVTANNTHAYYSTKGLVDGYYSADGVDGGKWRTADGTTSGGAEVYAIIDLVMPYTVNAIKTEIWWDTYCTKNSGTVYGSYDGVDYEKLVSFSGEGVQTLEVMSENKYRFIKVASKDWPGLGWGLWELEVYSTDVFVPQGENVARGKDVVASNEHTAWYPASKLVDGNFSSAGYDGGRWTTNYGTVSGGEEVYATIDLGKPYNINAFVGEIVWTGQSTKSNAKIYGSTDGVEFNDLLATISGEGVQTVPVALPQKYQYIKVAGTDWPGMNWGMWELQIYSLDDYLNCETTYVVSETDMATIDKIPASGEFAVKVNYFTEGGARALTGYLAEYGVDDSLVDVVTVDIFVAPGEKNGELIVPVSVSEDTDSFRFFVWDENNVPFTKAPVLEK